MSQIVWLLHVGFRVREDGLVPCSSRKGLPGRGVRLPTHVPRFRSTKRDGSTSDATHVPRFSSACKSYRSSTLFYIQCMYGTLPGTCTS